MRRRVTPPNPCTRARNGHARTHAWQEKRKQNSYNNKKNKFKDQLLFKQPDVSIYQKHTKLAIHTTPPIPEDMNNEQKKIYSKNK